MKNQTKRMCSLVIAICMLFLIVSGCNAGTTNSSQVSSSSDASEAASSESSSGEEGQLKPFSVLSMQLPGYTDWNVDHVEDYEMIGYLNDKMAEYGVKLEFEVIGSEQWQSTIQTRIASSDLADLTLLYLVDASTLINLIDDGKLYDVDTLVNHGDGTAKKTWGEGGAASYLRKLDTYVDGKDYFIRGLADNAPSFGGDFRNWNASENWVPLIRQDWLDKVNMPMPTTTDEVIEVLKAFQENDVNGNGIPDERMFVDFGTDYFKNGIAQWFGLAPYMFQIDEDTGEAVLPFFQPGFRDYVEFVKKGVEAGVIYLSDDGYWTNIASTIPQNTVGIYTYYPKDANTFLTGIDNEAKYVTMGQIEGSKGVNPAIMCAYSQEITAPWGFSSSADLDAAAAVMDVLWSEWYHYWHEYGVEGVTYDFNDAGVPVLNYTYTADYARETHGKVKGENLVSQTIFPFVRMNASYLTYKGESLSYDSPKSFQTGAYFTEFMKEDLEKANNLTGWENLNTALGYLETNDRYGMNADFAISVAMATPEETELIAKYSTELNTYMSELFANLISGAWSFDDWDSYEAQMNELHLQDMLKVYQDLYNRYAENG